MNNGHGSTDRSPVQQWPVTGPIICNNQAVALGGRKVYVMIYIDVPSSIDEIQIL